MTLYLIYARLNFKSNFIDLISAVCSFIKVLIYYNKTLSGRLRGLNNKRKVPLGNPKIDRSRLRELFIAKFKSQFKRGFIKVVWLMRAGRLREVVGRKASTVFQHSYIFFTGIGEL